jgi:Holliday junction resolvasome RuvABC endonuclease subunit
MPRVTFKTSGVDSVLAIDAASRTGWAHLDTDGSIMSGSERFSEAGGQHGLTFRSYKMWLEQAINELTPSLIAYEAPGRTMSNAAMKLLGGFYGVTMLIAHKQRLAVHLVAPAEVKKAVTGKGNAGKSEVMAAVRALGHDVANPDQADAVAILLTSIKQMGGRRAA